MLIIFLKYSCSCIAVEARIIQTGSTKRNLQVFTGMRLYQTLAAALLQMGVAGTPQQTHTQYTIIR